MYYEGIWTGRGRNVDAALADLFRSVRADPTMDHPDITRVTVLDSVADETRREAEGRAAADLEDGVGYCSAVAIDGGFLFAAYYNGDDRQDDEDDEDDED